ncbi:PhoU domain-containing protein, partial [Litorivivens sp.]
LRSLERIGDHARNIAEHVIYLVEGKDVRHVGLKEMEAEVKG